MLDHHAARSSPRPRENLRSSENGLHRVAKALSDGGLPGVRADVPGVENLETVTKAVGGNLSPIPLAAKTLEFSDAKHRGEFFRQWRKAMQG